MIHRREVESEERMYYGSCRKLWCNSLREASVFLSVRVLGLKP
jgi:hypothetical protein